MIMCLTNVLFMVFRFFLGSNKVMQVSLGRSTADEIRPGLHKVSKVALTSTQPMVSAFFYFDK